jgi:branched-subunit amino acid aminotransferase/4-amino-4-deoxychorismate lyase
MQQVRALVKERPVPMPIVALVGHPWHYRGMQDKIDGNLRGLLLDVCRWAREGLIDAALPAGYYRDGGTPEKASRALQEETGRKINCWTYAWVPTTTAEADQAFASAEALGADHILFWEADYIDDRSNAAQIQTALRARARKT